VLLALSCLLGASGATLRQSQGVSPIAKVLELLTSLEAKIKTEGEAETTAHKAYVEWCDDGRTQMGFEIKTLKAEIEDLTATKEKAISDISSQQTKIEDLSGSIAQDDADLKAATEIRGKESAEFQAAEAELLDVISSLDRAINVLERKMRSSALVQAQVNTKDVQEIVKTLSAVIDAASLGNNDKKRLVAMVQGASEDTEDDFGAPAPEVYKQKSEGIIEVLEDLRSKAETQLAELRHQETAGKHSFELEAQSLRDSIAASTKEMSEAKTTLASASETRATSEGDLAVAVQSLAETSDTLKVTSAGCSTAVEDYDASTVSRAEELKALAAAIDAIKGSLNASEASVYGFLQTSSISGADEHTSSRLQTRADLANFEVVNLIRRLARKENSAALSQLASRVAAAIRFGSRSGEDPFVKVKGLISEMILTLEKEAGQEATHKAWCDEQYGETKAKTDDLRHTVDRLTSKIDKAKATSMTLKDESKDLQAALAQIAKSQAELDQLRRGQNKAYSLAKEDMETGLRGVRQAMKVLREYYEGDASESSAHAKAGGAGSTIVGMLEVIQSDLSKGLAQAEMAEDSAATEYEKVSMQNRLTVTGYEQDVKYKTKEAASLDKAVVEMSSDRDSSQTELDAVLEYSKSVRGACEVKPESYEERTSRREAEVAGLKEALSILSGEGMFLQKQKKGSLRGKH